MDPNEKGPVFTGPFCLTCYLVVAMVPVVLDIALVAPQVVTIPLQLGAIPVDFPGPGAVAPIPAMMARRALLS